MDHLRCVVERITYQNETNGFSVIKCRAKGYNDLVTVVGNMPDVHVGSVLTMEGQWRVDRKFGRQFSAEKWEETLPATTYGIKKGWQEQREIKNIMLFLQSNDVSTAHAARIYKTYGNDSISIVEENPYRLADDIWGIGFKTADQIAAKLLDVEEPELEMTLDEMMRTSDVIVEKGSLSAENKGNQEDAIYLPPFYFSETGCAKRLLKLLASERNTKLDADKVMERVVKHSKITYDKVQLEAIRQAVSSKVMALTGGPGTGKTTTTLGIISAYRMAAVR